MKPYKPGQVIGNFEIIERIAHSLTYNGASRGRYRVRCLKCGEITKLNSQQIMRRNDCGCMNAARKKQAPVQGECWMSDGEIYRSWKAMRNPRNGISVLAQLNDVPLSVIEDIIDRESNKQDE